MQQLYLFVGFMACCAGYILPLQGQAWTTQNPATLPREAHRPVIAGESALALDSNLAALDSLTEVVKLLPKVVWQEPNFAAAKAEAAETGKPILVKFTATWCGPCRLLEQQTFADSSVADFVNDNMVPLALDVDTDFDGIDLAREHRVRLLPTVLVMDAKGKVTKRYEGMFGPTVFLRQHRGY